MGELEKLLENHQIKFPRPVNLDGAEHLMTLIAECMPAHFGGCYSTRIEINAFNEKSTELKVEKSPAEFKGTVTHRETSEYACFRLNIVHSDGKPVGYDSLTFEPIPGNNTGKPFPSELRVWQEVRTIIEKYFSAN